MPEPTTADPIKLSDEQKAEIAAASEKAMGQKEKDWLKPTDNGKVEYNSKKPLKIEYTANSYADIVRDGVVLRTVPFLWQVDSETNQGWALFWADEFYGQLRKQSIWPWRRVKRQTIITGFRKGAEWTDNTIGAGFKAKFEENAATQVPVRANYTKAELIEFVNESQFTSQIFLLKMHLEKYLKPKTNWGFVILIAAIIGIAVIAIYLYMNPGIILGIEHTLGMTKQ